MRYRVGHPTRFCDIVLRIARRRFVPWAEVESLARRYAEKHNYYYMYLSQHGIERQLKWRYRGMGGVIGERCYDEVFKPALHCRIGEDRKPIHRQHCNWCGVGINPVWNGRLKKRLCCKNPVCHEFQRFAPYGGLGGKTVHGWTWAERSSVDRTLYPLAGMIACVMWMCKERLKWKKQRRHMSAALRASAA